MRHLNCILATVLSLSSLATATSNCKCTPLDDCWPSEEAWSSLNSTLRGALLHPQPPGSVCHASQPDYSPSACQALLESWHLSTTHLEHPLSVDYPLWADPKACPPIFPNGTSLAGDAAAGERGCSRGRLPEYVVNATQSWHVQEALNWAAEQGVRVVIKNTGHSHLGRSTGFGSLSIWTHNLRGIEWHDAWDSACPGLEEDWKGMAVTVGAGELVGDCIKAAAEHNAVVVTGANPGVGVVGWATGGGHGYLSQTYGFGSDNVLAATVVTPLGEVIAASPCANPDLYYAIRGGGGGTFGVITSLTFRAYPSPQTTSWDLQATLLNSDEEDKFHDLVADFHELLPEMKRQGLQGYYHIFGPPLVPYLLLGVRFMAFDQPDGAVEAATQSFRDKIKVLEGTMRWHERIQRHDKFHQAYKGDIREEPVGQGGLALGSRLLSEDALVDKAEAHGLRSDDTAKARFKRMLKSIGPRLDPNITDASPMVIGHVIANADNRDLDTPLKTTWRDTVTHFLFARGWPDTATESEIAAVRDDVTHTKGSQLRALDPSSGDDGAYFNEMDAFDGQWKRRVWGENYDRLGAVKNKHDPEGVLWCWHCVGSEEWEEDSKGRLCRSSDQVNQKLPVSEANSPLERSRDEL